MGNLKPNPLFYEQTRVEKVKKGDRWKNSMEVVLINGVKFPFW